MTMVGPLERPRVVGSDRTAVETGALLQSEKQIFDTANWMLPLEKSVFGCYSREYFIEVRSSTVPNVTTFIDSFQFIGM